MPHNTWETLNFSADSGSACSYVLNNNPSNNAPYHNLYHILTVTKNCYEASLFYKFNREETETLLLAALFHDYDHSMGKEKDNINIQRALKGLEAWANGKPHVNRDAIIQIIKATEYPYIFPSDKASLSQQIIRDADLTQYMEDNWVQQIIFGLSSEMNIPVAAMLGGQKQFIEAIKPATKWFEQKWNTNKDAVLSNIEQLKSLYNSH